MPSHAVELVRFLRSWRRSNYFLLLINSLFKKRTPDIRYVSAGAVQPLGNRLRAVNLLRPTRMCRAMRKYGSDKGTLSNGHNYSTVYSVIFRDFRRQPVRIFEIGLGSNDPGIPFTMRNGRPGASVRAWRELFPQAHVYGADIDRAVLFQEERIETFYCDQLSQAAVTQLWSQPGLQEPMDIIIDDGLHTFEGNTSFLEASLDHVSPGGIYIIEDVEYGTLTRWRDQIEMVYSKRYPTYEFMLVVLPHPRNRCDNNLLVIRRAA